jgi:HlyD family secretion protein
VRISFDKLDPKILPDMSVKVAFLSQTDSAKKTKARGPTARAIIPQAAVRVASAESYVFAVRDGRIERRVVTLGRRISHDVQVMAGVNPGDELVVRGPENLQDAMKVKIHQ